MSRFVTRTSRNQALSSTAPEEIKLVEGYAAAELEVEMAGEYNGIPLSGHFAPYNSRSEFYQQGIQLGVEVKYWIGVATDEGWECYQQFTGIVRRASSHRPMGRVVP